MVRISRVREYTNELCLHHSHPELEINVFLGGTGTYWVNGVRYPVRSGDVFLFLGDMFHSMAIENERAGVDLIKVIFSLGEIGQYGSDELYTGLVEAVYPGDEKLNVRIPGGVKHAAAILRAAELLVQNRVDMLSADGEKFLLLYILNTAKEYHAAHGRTGSGAFNAAVYRRVRNAMLYLDDHYTEDISVDEVGRSEFFSTNRFTDAFRKYTGSTPKKYLTMKRIAGAVSLIARNESTMTEIAYSVGFNSTAAFNKEFLNVMGMSPTEYRKTLAGNPDRQNL